MVLSAQRAEQLDAIFAEPSIPATAMSPERQAQLDAIFAQPTEQPVAIGLEAVTELIEPEPINLEGLDPGFIQRVSEDFEKRGKIFEEIQAATESGEQSTAEGIFQIAGKVGAGAVFDFLGEAIISAGKGVSAITPDFIEDPIKEGIKEAGIAFLNTDIGKVGAEALTQGIESYTEFARNNPRAARNIESVVNIALLFSPVKGVPKAAPKTTGLTVAGERLIEVGKKQTIAQKAEFVTGLIMPKKTAAVAREQVSRTTEKGLLRGRVVTPSTVEQSIAREVNKLPVSKSKTLQGNFNIISKETTKEANKLKAALAKNDVFFPRREFKARMKRVIAALNENPLITGDAQKAAIKVAAQMDKITAKNKSSASGLLQSRKQLDKLIRKQKGTAVFDPTRDNAITIAVRDIRNATNDFIDTQATNVAVKESLRKQSNLLSAMDNIAPKAAEEGANAVVRQWQTVTKLFPLRGEFNQTMATMFGIGGLGAAATFAPWFTKLATAGLVTVIGGKAITSPAAKKVLGQLLKKIDIVIRKTRDTNLVRQMRLDRALIIELLKGQENE